MDAVAVISEIFQTNINGHDLEEKISDVLNWNSFEILNFMTEMSERYQVDITIEEITRITRLQDLVILVQACQTYGGKR